MSDTTPAPSLHGTTHRGRIRSQNQDHFVVCVIGDRVRVAATSLPNPPSSWEMDPGGPPGPGEVVVAAVADGVGGGPGGEEASRWTVTLLPEAIRAALQAVVDESGTPSLLTAAALAVHAQLGRHADENPAVAGMATTLTAWVAQRDRAWVVQVGDSRCYRLRDGELERLTVDQTLAQDLVNRGVIPSVGHAPAGYDNILTSALGGTGPEPAVQATDRRPGDVVLVCSDGVMKHIPDQVLRTLLASEESAESLARRIVRDAVEDGGIDNVTAVLVKE